MRYYGKWMRDEAEKRIGHLYPKAILRWLRATVVAWLWSRTVAGPSPAAAGAMSRLCLASCCPQEGKETWIEPIIDPNARDGYRFEVRSGKIEKEEIENKKNGTKTGGSANFRCILTGAIIQRDHIVAEGKAGRMGQRMMAIVAEGPRGRTIWLRR